MVSTRGRRDPHRDGLTARRGPGRAPRGHRTRRPVASLRRRDALRPRRGRAASPAGSGMSPSELLARAATGLPPLHLSEREEQCTPPHHHDSGSRRYREHRAPARLVDAPAILPRRPPQRPSRPPPAPASHAAPGVRTGVNQRLDGRCPSPVRAVLRGRMRLLPAVHLLQPDRADLSHQRQQVDRAGRAVRRQHRAGLRPAGLIVELAAQCLLSRGGICSTSKPGSGCSGSPRRRLEGA